MSSKFFYGLVFSGIMFSALAQEEQAPANQKLDINKINLVIGQLAGAAMANDPQVQKLSLQFNPAVTNPEANEWAARASVGFAQSAWSEAPSSLVLNAHLKANESATGMKEKLDASLGIQTELVSLTQYAVNAALNSSLCLAPVSEAGANEPSSNDSNTPPQAEAPKKGIDSLSSQPYFCEVLKQYTAIGSFNDVWNLLTDTAAAYMQYNSDNSKFIHNKIAALSNTQSPNEEDQLLIQQYQEELKSNRSDRDFAMALSFLSKKDKNGQVKFGAIKYNQTFKMGNLSISNISLAFDAKQVKGAVSFIYRDSESQYKVYLEKVKGYLFDIQNEVEETLQGLSQSLQLYIMLGKSFILANE